MDTVKVDGKEVPLMNAKVKTTIKHKETGVIYKDEKEWKGLGIDPASIQRDVLVTLPRLDLFAKTK
jgi:hypothetical protein|tara:strand:+ start:168 stop:365 length:198 start_codon:yes stop_codon:yes gene_type:complete